MPPTVARRVRRSRRTPPASRRLRARCRRRRGLAQPEPDPGQQLGEPERLGHVVVGAALERGHRVGHRVAGGQHDHRAPASPATAAGRAPRSRRGRAGRCRAPSGRSRRSARGRGPRGRRRRRWSGDPSARRPLATNEAIAARPRRSGCGPSASLLVGGPRERGQVMHEPRAAGGGVRRPSTRPPWAPAMARTIESPRPKPSSLAAYGGAAETFEDHARGPRAAPPARCRAPTAGPSAAGRTPTPIATASPASVCLTALSASCSTAWVSRCASTTTVTSARPVEHPVAVPEAAGLREQVVGQPLEVDRPRLRKSGRSLLASRIRSPTSRDIRSISSSSSCAGLGRPPRGCRRRAARGARGARSAASSARGRRRRGTAAAPTNAASSRSSIPLKVRVRAVMSSLPVTGQPPRQVGLGDLLGGRAQRRSAGRAAARTCHSGQR